MESFLDVRQICGQRAVSAADVRSNKAKLEAARRTGKRIAIPPLRERPATPALLPISPATWWNGVRSGRFPAPVKLGSRTLWRRSDIEQLLGRLAQQGAPARGRS